MAVAEHQQDTLLTVAQVAEILNVNRNLARKIILREMRYNNLNEGGTNLTIRVWRSEVMRYLERHTIVCECIPVPPPRREKRRKKTTGFCLPTWEEAQAMDTTPLKKSPA